MAVLTTFKYTTDSCSCLWFRTNSRSINLFIWNFRRIQRQTLQLTCQWHGCQYSNVLRIYSTELYILWRELTSMHRIYNLLVCDAWFRPTLWWFPTFHGDAENARHENARNAIVWNTACCICLSIAEKECMSQQERAPDFAANCGCPICRSEITMVLRLY